MKVKEFRKLTKKKPKYMARTTRACPVCWNELKSQIGIDGKDRQYCPAYKCMFFQKEIITFHSKGEQLRGAQLKRLEREAIISGLERQVRCNLFPKRFFEIYIHNGKRIKGKTLFYDDRRDCQGRYHDCILGPAQRLKDLKPKDFILVERERFYVLDFKYTVCGGGVVCEDFKGYQTKDSKKKIKLFEALYNVKVTITTREDLK